MRTTQSLTYDFLFDNEHLSSYNMILCDFNGEASETISMGNSLTFNTIKPSLSDSNFLSSSSYDEVLSATIQICKNFCNNEDIELSVEDISNLNRWLCRKEFHRFKIFQDGYEDIYFQGSFNNPQAIKANGKIIGLEYTFTSDSPYGYLDTISVDFTTSASTPFTLTNFSHEIGILYPSDFSCKCLTKGNLVISNSLDLKSVSVANCSANEIIKLDGKRKIIYSSDSGHTTLYNDFNYNFFRLVGLYDNVINEITTSIPCEIHLEYNPIRKVGIL